MALMINLVFNLAYFGITLLYPGYQILFPKDNKSNKLWAMYFLLLGIITLLEGTFLFPIVWL